MALLDYILGQKSIPCVSTLHISDFKNQFLFVREGGSVVKKQNNGEGEYKIIPM